MVFQTVRSRTTFFDWKNWPEHRHTIVRGILRSHRLLLSLTVLAAFAVVACDSPSTTSSGALIVERPTEGADVLDKYFASTKTLQETLKGKEMQVQISAELPRLNKSGTMKALRKISDLGKVSYKMLGFSGDNTIKNDVIARYLTAETQGNSDTSQYAITPANYKFKYLGLAKQEGRRSHVFKLEPRQKRIGLFKGELWIDSETFMPMKESGQFVKNPSVFLKKVEFARSYALLDGVSVPKHIDSTIETRVVGKAQIAIEFATPTTADSSAETVAGPPASL